jgi:hypothetical protein
MTLRGISLAGYIVAFGAISGPADQNRTTSKSGRTT